MVKQLNVRFDDKVFKKLKKAKELLTDKSWGDWIIELVEMSRRENEFK